MGLNVTRVAAQSRKLAISTDEGTINLEYYPNLFSPALVTECTVKAEEENLNATVLVLTRVIKNWDIMQDAPGDVLPLGGEAQEIPLPVNYDAIMGLNINWITQIDKFIQEDLSPTVPRTRAR